MTSTEARAVAVSEPQGTMVRESVTSPTDLLVALVHAASDQSTDIEKMEKLFRMHKELKEMQAKEDFNNALSECQKEMGQISANADNSQTRSKYATYAKLDKVLRPIYTRHDFSISFDTGETAKADCVLVLAYASRGGYTRTYRVEMPADGKGAKGGDVMTKTHAAGAAISYGSRYLLKAIFNVAIGEEDTDGNPPEPRYGENVGPERRIEIQQLASRMKSHLAANAVDDAVIEGDNFGLDGADEKSFLWSFFDAPQRSAMKKAGARMREEAKKSPISEAQRKRLEARISELKADREEIKAFCVKRFGKEHFAELSKADYTALDLHLDGMEALTPAASPETQPEGATQAGEASAAAVAARTKALDAYTIASPAIRKAFGELDNTPISEMTVKGAINAEKWLRKEIDLEAAK